MCGPHHCLRRGASAPNPAILCGLLKLRQNASVLEQGCAGFSPGSANRCDQFTRHPGRTSSPLCPRLSCRYTQAVGRSLFFRWLRAISLIGYSEPGLGQIAANTEGPQPLQGKPSELRHGKPHYLAPVSALRTSPNNSHVSPLNLVSLYCSIGEKSVAEVLIATPD